MKEKLRGAKREELERAYQKCLLWFSAFPRTKIGLTELAYSINSSKTATKQAVEALLPQDILFREIIGRAWILSVNLKNILFIRKKISYNLEMIYESGILDAVHKAVPQARATILFGSYRWGDDTDESDIDIAVETLDNHEIKILKLGIVEQLGYRKNVPVNLHIFSRNKIDLNLFANIANGIVLDGFLEVRP